MSAFAPVLLDRLSAHDASTVPESNSRVLARLRSDLEKLFNVPGAVWALDAKATPNVARSVLNYGIGNIAGITLSTLDSKILEARILFAILTFEPRIIRHTLRITWGKRPRAAIPELHFHIEGVLRKTGAAYAFKFQSIWNTESGEARISLPSGITTYG
ncbi:type VI secretion system baseplate subunit TssE [Pseudomonas vranovensis]|uniref:type VI secretion system baseplate subunit TssE n=1 Tax=Pseudomonas vranovensis TaxID=321661 RepID=UPI000A058A53|nr:GPW/gp25 family protein [Pseudomonas vranovensis]